MNVKKPNRRKPGGTKLEPIDWREFANDAVLNGNMSTLYRRPPTEDPTAYASAEAMIEIEKRVVRSAELEPDKPTVGTDETAGLTPSAPAGPTVGELPTHETIPTVGTEDARNLTRTAPASDEPTVGLIPAPGAEPSVGLEPPELIRQAHTSRPTVSHIPTLGQLPTPQARPTAPPEPAAATGPTVGNGPRKKVKPIRDVQDALTLAGQVLYRAMLGNPGDATATSCTKGYRQLAAETRLDKDTVRDLIVEFKEKGIVRETATYDPDTRSSKTYEVLSYETALRMWREAGIQFVTTGRQRPLFCSALGELLTLKPTVGPNTAVGPVSR